MRRTAVDWRDRADEARAIGEEIKDPSCRQIMLNIAESYERLAQNAEELDEAALRLMKHVAAQFGCRSLHRKELEVIAMDTDPL